MERYIDGSLGCEMIRHESVKLRHDGLNIQWVFVQEQWRVVFLDNQCRLCGGLTVARFVLACADAADTIAGKNANKQNFNWRHAALARGAQQNHFPIVDRRFHGILRSISFLLTEFPAAYCTPLRPSFPHVFSRSTMLTALRVSKGGNPGESGTGPRLRHSEVTTWDELIRHEACQS